MIIVVGLTRDFLPSSWGSYAPSYVEVLTLLGSFGLFLTLFLLFCRYLPMVAMAEVKSILPSAQPHARRARDGVGVGGRGKLNHGNNPSTDLSNEPKLWGLLAEYPDAGALKAAAEKVRDAGYRQWDCYTPYPVHGLDQAMGVRPTILPWLVLGAA